MASPLIVNNTISGGSPQMSAGTGIYADGGGYFIANNTITGCLTGINVAEGNNIIEGNLIINNTNGIMFTGEEDTTAILRHNTICNNSIGLVNYYYSSAEAMTINMFYNNIVRNQQYNVRWLNLTNNWWGTTNQTAIGLVIGNTTTYIPILTAPDALAPPIPETLNTIILPIVSPSPTPTSSPNPTAFATTSATTSSSTQNNVTEKPTETQPEKAIPELTPLVVLLLLGVTLLATTLMVTKQRIAQSKK
jgi:hypothetical protein